MKLSIRRYIKRISLKNLIAPFIVLVVVVIIGHFIPFEEMFFPETVYSADELAESVSTGTTYISYEIDDLVYTGYDYYDGGKISGRFYYAFTSDEQPVVFFLVKEGQEPGKAAAKAVYKDEYVNTFIANYAADLELSPQALQELSGGYILSSCDYDLYYYIILAASLAAIAFVCALYILWNFIVFFFPSIHPSCRRLKKYGLSGRDFSDIDRELKNDRIIEAGNIYATSHYMIVFGKGTIYMIPLFNIVWAYRYVSRQIFVSRRLLSYTLVVYTSPSGKITMRGNKKKATDKILSFFNRDFSHITVGYTEENHKMIREMFKRGEL